MDLDSKGARKPLCPGLGPDRSNPWLTILPQGFQPYPQASRFSLGKPQPLPRSLRATGIVIPKLTALQMRWLQEFFGDQVKHSKGPGRRIRIPKTVSCTGTSRKHGPQPSPSIQEGKGLQKGPPHPLHTLGSTGRALGTASPLSCLFIKIPNSDSKKTREVNNLSRQSLILVLWMKEKPRPGATML